MISTKWILSSAVLLAAIGCDKSPGVQTRNVTPAEVAQADKTLAHAAQTKSEYESQFEQRLVTIDAEMAVLREKNRNLKGAAKADWERTFPQLQAKRDAAYAKLTEVSQSSGEAWKDIKNGAQAAWDEMDDAFRDATKRF